MTKIDVQIRKICVNLDPRGILFHVAIADAEGVWCETFGSEELLRAFLRGVEAASSFPGVTIINIPEIPQHASELASDESRAIHQAVHGRVVKEYHRQGR